MPKGASLDATGRILAAPFTLDGGQARYLAGYDGPFANYPLG